MKVRYDLLHSHTFWLVISLIIPAMCTVGGIFQLNIWLILGGLTSGYFILFLMKNMVYSIGNKLKIFSVQKGFHELNYIDVKKINIIVDYVDSDINFFYQFSGKSKKAYYIFKSKYEMCDGLNIIIKHLPIEMIDLKFLEKLEIKFDGEKFKY